MFRNTVIDLKPPNDFDESTYEAVVTRLRMKSESHKESWSHFADGWKGVIYRFMMCAESDENWLKSLRRFGDAPSHAERYVQERELFLFFVSGLSALECCCYSLYGIASIVDPIQFALTNANLKKINPENMLTRFKTVFTTDSITGNLEHIVNSTEYKQWKDIRNVLSHRSTPGRQLFLSVNTGNRTQSAIWKIGIILDEQTTTLRRIWLADRLNTFFRATDLFATKYV